MAEEELQKVQGIGSTTAMKMIDAGYKSVESVANADPNRLAEATGVRPAVAEKIIDAAKEQLGKLQEKSIAVGAKGIIGDATKGISEGIVKRRFIIPAIIPAITDRLSNTESVLSVDLDGVKLELADRKLFQTSGNLTLRARGGRIKEE